jgi:adenosylhomocysteinase
MKMDDAAKLGDIFITATGMKDVIIGRHFDVMKEGALVCNTGHYDCEINLVDLEARSKGKREIRAANEEYVLKDGRRIYVLAQGRLVNLAAAEGHPSEVMDMSFANQYLALCKLAKDGKSMKAGVYELPPEQDQELARIKLGTQGLSIDELTAEQIRYNDDYSAGT